MRIASGSTDRKICFVAVDATDLVTREEGLSAFTVYRSVNGGSAVAYTTPTVTEISSANMPGVYALDLDEALTLNSARDTEQVCLHVTCSGMQPVTLTFELYRPETTEGQTLTVAGGTGNAAVQSIVADAVNATAIAADAITAAKIATAAITSDKFAPGAIDATAIAANAIASTKIADGAITAAKIADAAIDSGTFAPGAIDASAIAPDAIGSSEFAQAAATKIADTVLRRSMASARASSSGDAVTGGRNLLGALSKLKNKGEVASGTLSVYEEDDTTVYYTEALTSDAAAEPIVSWNP